MNGMMPSPLLLMMASRHGNRSSDGVAEWQPGSLQLCSLPPQPSSTALSYAPVKALCRLHIRSG